MVDDRKPENKTAPLRVLLAKIGLHGPDPGIKVVARALRDVSLGADVQRSLDLAARSVQFDLDRQHAGGERNP